MQRRGCGRGRRPGLGAAAVVPSRRLPWNRASRSCFRAAEMEVVAEATKVAAAVEEAAEAEAEEEEEVVEAEGAARRGCCRLMCCSARTVAAHACVTRCT